MNLRKPVALVIVLTLSACMGGPTALREKPAGVHSFEVEGAVADVANRIQTRSAQCYGGGTYAPSGVQTSQTRSSLNMDAARDAAQIDVTLYGALGPQTWLLMDLQPAGPGRTRVDVSYARSGYDRRAQAVERWLKEGYEKCR